MNLTLLQYPFMRECVLYYFVKYITYYWCLQCLNKIWAEYQIRFPDECFHFCRFMKCWIEVLMCAKIHFSGSDIFFGTQCVPQWAIEMYRSKNKVSLQSKNIHLFQCWSVYVPYMYQKGFVEIHSVFPKFSVHINIYIYIYKAKNS